MSSDESLEELTNTMSSEIDKSGESSNGLVSKGEDIEPMALNQNEGETTSGKPDDTGDVAAELQKGTSDENRDMDFIEPNKSTVENLPLESTDIFQSKQEITTSENSSEYVHPGVKTGGASPDFKPEGKEETPTDVLKQDHIKRSVETNDVPDTEQRVEDREQDTEEHDSEINFNEPSNLGGIIKHYTEGTNESEKNIDGIFTDSEKNHTDMIATENNPFDDQGINENILEEKKSLFLKKSSKNESAAIITEVDTPVVHEAPFKSPSRDNNETYVADRPNTAIDSNKSAQEQGSVEETPITDKQSSSDQIRKLPPIPVQYSNGMNDDMSKKEGFAAPTQPVTTSPPLPPRQSTTTTAPPILPPIRKQQEQKTKNAVPPPLEEEMKSEKFRKIFEETKRSSHSHGARMGSKTAQLDSTAEINLIASRYRKTSHHLNKEGEETRESLQEGQSFLRSTYTSFLENLPEYNEVEEVEEGDREMFKIDWSFWTQVVNDFATVASNEPEKLETHVTNGIPPQIRGIIWQLMTNSKSREMEDIYETLLNTESPHEATIRRDLRRTKFVPEDKMESLFKIIKVYSVYDPDVGYTQGMGFIAAPLLINCENEAESFGLMVGLMKNYGLRELFLPGMPGLMLMLYQFDRLLEEHSPTLYNRLTREGVSSTMYATQWFLTFFAYKFPLEFVLRIFDIVFVEGIEVLLKFAVNLMLKNEENLVRLRFDELLEFLKDELFTYYLLANHDNDSVLQMQLPGGGPLEGYEDGSSPSYNVDLFVHDAMTGVYITPLTLRRYKGEFMEIHELEQKKENHYESLRIQNHQLQREAQKLEHDYSVLNEENISAANELIEHRLNMEMLLDEKNDLVNTITDIEQQIEEEIRKQNLPNPDASLPKADLKEDLERTISRNNEVMMENSQMEERIKELQQEIDELISINKEQVSTASLLESDSKGKGKKGWTGFKKVFK
ncbi:GTPase-activating protein GYP5 [Saccharomyces eubayanus]|uniref:GTPase-activating protein GYP5 n=1 Tax=Saccharomyces eubayanus TaxID=1080349 RepID=UPI0006C25004|nr:GYP5-like protein [Saccharomyces eubayanus]KOG96074.1 GYP5-like protein [Saccharomyces eubayanus]